MVVSDISTVCHLLFKPNYVFIYIIISFNKDV